MLGLQKGTVKIELHSEYWHQLFAEEAARISEAICEITASIEHIGSTSVRGLAAKPIIDISVGVKKAADGERCVRPLENIGYESRGEHGIAGRFYFVKGEPRTHRANALKFLVS